MSDMSTTKQNNHNKQKIYDEALLARTELYKAKNRAIAKSEQLTRRSIFEMGIFLFSLLVAAFGVFTTISPHNNSLYNDQASLYDTEYYTERSLQNDGNGFTGGGIATNSNKLQAVSESSLNVRQLSEELVANRWIMGSLVVIVIVSLLWSSDITKIRQLKIKIDTTNKILNQLDQELFRIYDEKSF
ncbi:MAG: hypothetical protein QNJ37_10940 [Crocosphaera sp.]|nr:hypothetical protein [Crocosphaera sp.]